MGKPKDLLKKQEITFDKHHWDVPMEWDRDLHFHKKLIVSGMKGRKVSVSGVFHVAEKGIDVVYDSGNNTHKKITNDKERDLLENHLKKEIRDAMSDDKEARTFIEHVSKQIESLSKGQDSKTIASRKKQAFDNIMSALGVSTARSVSLANTNGDLLSFYMDSPDGYFDIGYLLYTLVIYQKYYHAYVDEYYPIFYIIYIDGQLSLGEFTPYTLLKYRYKGFKISRKSIMEAINNNEY